VQIVPTNISAKWACSPDGKWIYFYDGKQDSPLRRVSTDGGQPETVAGSVFQKTLIGTIAISPDGKTMALLVNDFTVAPEDFALKIAFLDLTGSPKERVRFLPLESGRRIVLRAAATPDTTGLHFTPDGKNVGLLTTENGADNIWLQHLASTHRRLQGPPHHQLQSRPNHRLPLVPRRKIPGRPPLPPRIRRHPLHDTSSAN
jgi:WD40-like Beta Propeller Repeat